MCTYVHTYVHTYKHLYIVAYTYVHTYVCTCICGIFIHTQEGDIWPNSQAEVSVIFRPEEAARCDPEPVISVCLMYLQYVL